MNNEIQEPVTDIDKVIAETKNEIVNNELKKERKPRTKKDKSVPVMQPNMVTLNPAQYKDMLGAIIGFSGVYLAKVSKWEGFELTKEEIELLSTQGSDIAVEFMPQVNSKYVKLGAFSMTLIAVYGIRYMEFKEVHAKRVANSGTTTDNVTHEQIHTN